MQIIVFSTPLYSCIYLCFFRCNVSVRFHHRFYGVEPHWFPVFIGILAIKYRTFFSLELTLVWLHVSMAQHLNLSAVLCSVYHDSFWSFLPFFPLAVTWTLQAHWLVSKNEIRCEVSLATCGACTSVWTICWRCRRRSNTQPYRSMVPLESSCCRTRSKAMKVPVRPTPALTHTQIHSNVAR